MPPPWDVGKVFLNFLISGELIFKLYYTVLAIIVGLLASIVIAIIMTMLPARSRKKKAEEMNLYGSPGFL